MRTTLAAASATITAQTPPTAASEVFPQRCSARKGNQASICGQHPERHQKIDGDDDGFFIHPVVAVDADDEALLGVVGARIWTREEEPTPAIAAFPLSRRRAGAELDAAETAAGQLASVASQVVVVADREGDIYPLFSRRPEGIDLVVRASHDRVTYR